MRLFSLKRIKEVMGDPESAKGPAPVTEPEQPPDDPDWQQSLLPMFRETEQQEAYILKAIEGAQKAYNADYASASEVLAGKAQHLLDRLALGEEGGARPAFTAAALPSLGRHLREAAEQARRGHTSDAVQKLRALDTKMAAAKTHSDNVRGAVTAATAGVTTAVAFLSGCVESHVQAGIAAGKIDEDIVSLRNQSHATCLSALSVAETVVPTATALLFEFFSSKAGGKAVGAKLTKAAQEPDAGKKVKIWARSAHVMLPSCMQMLETAVRALEQWGREVGLDWLLVEPWLLNDLLMLAGACSSLETMAGICEELGVKGKDVPALLPLCQPSARTIFKLCAGICPHEVVNAIGRLGGSPALLQVALQVLMAQSAQIHAQLNAASAQLTAQVDHIAHAVDELVKNQQQQQQPQQQQAQSSHASQELLQPAAVEQVLRLLVARVTSGASTPEGAPLGAFLTDASDLIGKLSIGG